MLRVTLQIAVCLYWLSCIKYTSHAHRQHDNAIYGKYLACPDKQGNGFAMITLFKCVFGTFFDPQET